MTTKEKIRFIADSYGYDAQSRQCIEEMAELTQAINKFWRKSKSDCCKKEDFELARKNIVEELADVQIMLFQMVYYILSANEIETAIEEKLDRQIRRIQEGRDE